MAPMRAARVYFASAFDVAVAALRGPYPEIDAAIEELRYTFALDYGLPEIPVDPQRDPNVYAIRLDYPPKGPGGLGQFLVTYHVALQTPETGLPYKVITLLALQDRDGWPNS